MIDSKIIVALDFSDLSEVENFIDPLTPDLCKLKVGKQLFTRCGPSIVERLRKKGFDVFLDLKFHDIPNTVKNACCAAADLGVWMVNVHAQGGRAMMEKTAASLRSYQNRPLLTAVTVLTSMSEEELKNDVGLSISLDDYVMRLARLAKESGLDGVVCSANEAFKMKEQLGADFKLVTPGIRPVDSGQDDQNRICTPVQAIKNGSDYLVIGRPITQSKYPIEVLQNINSEIA